ncbi:hypothetical protein LAZ67_1007944 [Cordylochernes scorpioides]|uniref:RNA-directed DNA polymerase n=1 Tax=Cordylochernes scorpioides TaxID=51811 RepID=A0ABY6K1F1_9ARAC|nr:hypothetical protein LAZ67_1007944 [Cordylochernes scorpioides]
MAQIQPPETFDFSTPNEWPKWRKRFERYLVVSGMKKKEEADKIDLFMYLMGDRADDIFRTFKFEKQEEATKIDSVLKAFDSHFCVRKNIIYERAKFNSRIQEDREPVDEFITSLYKLADSCEFEGLHEQLIRDRIVVGVRDKALSERMQLDSELTLEKAVKMVRQQEAVRQQQVDLQRPSTSQKVNQVKFNSKKQSPKQQQQPSRKKEKSAKTRSRCPKCGGFTHREGQACRAEGQKCNLCSKTGHFANFCPDKQAKTAEVKAVSELDEEIGFLLEVSAVEDSSNLDDDEGKRRRRWTAEIQVNGKQVKFKLDSQADVTCVPLCLFKKIMGQQRLVKSDINLRAAEFSELQTVGMFISTLRNGNYEIKEKIYVIRRLSKPLLSRRACELLNLARRIEVVATRINPIKEFPEVFEGLGQIGNPYEIKLKLDANSGFHQIPLSPDCQHLTTFITPFGRYKYCRMPFRISLAPEYFQRVMSIILQGMDGVMCYLDDILIFASDSKTHDRILRLVLRKLKEAKVTLNKAKCVFGVPRINFLGHILDEDGIRPDPAKIEAVAKMPAPTDVHGVRRFLGMVNHLGRKLRTTLPIAPENLNPKLVDSQTLKRKEGRRRKDMKSRYDRRCGATDMEELSEGDTVWITDMRTWGIVKQKASTPRSYLVDTPVGTLRRNRFHLRKGVTVQYPADPSTPTFSGEELVENEKTPVVDHPSNDSEDGQIRTRSGRIVKPAWERGGQAQKNTSFINKTDLKENSNMEYCPKDLIPSFNPEEGLKYSQWLKVFNQQIKLRNIKQEDALFMIPTLFKGNALEIYATICDEIDTLEDLHSRIMTFFPELERGLHKKFWQLTKQETQSVRGYYFEKSTQLNKETEDGITDGGTTLLEEIAPTWPRGGDLSRRSMEMSTPANSTNLAILGLHPSAYKVRRTPVIKAKWDIDSARGSERMWVQQTHGSWDNETIKEQISQLLKYGIIKPASSPYSSPVTLARKKGESDKTRLCIDFRKLNSKLIGDSFPIPLIENIIQKVQGSKVFSCLEILSAYWTVSLHEKDQYITCFPTTEGSYQWCRLPFGLRTAPAIFNRILSSILQKYDLKNVISYFDDILVFSNDTQSHLEHLKEIFEILQKEGIQLRKEKCLFFMKKINYLGYEIFGDQMSPSGINVDIIKSLPPPRNVRCLRSFLGSVTHYAKFINHFNKLRAPLNNLLKKDIKFTWTDECQKSFEALKEALVSKPSLQIYNPLLTTHIFCDASTAGLGGVLKQEYPDGTMKPIAFYSRALRGAESKYTITELELLAIIETCKRYHPYISGQRVIVHTDHKALIWLNNFKHTNGRLFRWSLRLSEYDLEFKYNKGCENYEADMLSRLPYSCFLSIQDLKEGQESLAKPSSKLYFNKDNITYIRLKNKDRVVVPPSLQQELIIKAHESLGHPGISAMARVISTQYYFKGMIGKIKNYILKCKTCQSVKKPTTPSYGLMGTLPLAEKPFDVVALDSILGLGEYNSTKNCLHVVVDHHSRYIWAFPSKSTSIATYMNIINQLLSIGKSKIIVTDRHPSFVSKRFNKFIQEKGIKHVMTSPSHPQCNGLVERANATIISKLRLHHQQNPRIPWHKLLQKALEEYRNTPHSITTIPPVYLLFGIDPFYTSDLTIAYPPIEEARKTANDNTKKLHLKLVKRYNESHKAPNLKIGDKVLYKIPYQSGQGKLMPAFYPEPYTIIAIPSPQTIEIDKPCQPENKRTTIVNISKIRLWEPVFEDTEENLKTIFPFQEEDLEQCLGT